jgi:hypothetical protein
VVLKVGDDVVFSQSNTYMHEAQTGELWKTQIGKEWVAKGLSTMPTPKESNLPAGTSANRSAAKCKAGFNADRRKKLLEGSQVYCARRHDTKHGTVVLRATLTMKIPQQANFSTV